jgi:hypothetical protein
MLRLTIFGRLNVWSFSPGFAPQASFWLVCDSLVRGAAALFGPVWVFDGS